MAAAEKAGKKAGHCEGKRETEDGGTPQRNLEEVREGVEASGDGGDAEEVGIGEPVRE
jgi:hypothetical protein